MTNCKNWKKYKGIYKPRCNQGNGCKKCWEIYHAKNKRSCGHSSRLTPVLKVCHECLVSHMQEVAKEKAKEEAKYFKGM